ncbi:ATP-binding protein [Rikenella microfusus]|uniref:DNA replication protein n=1 Tax=Rikenella microfusus TaxID=28139 RepID=A0A379MW09_9BACT|nr:ATP-binding protein [Rikenella microfusus]SUE34832.1 DNA replication protein [Rikenella microfusus]
MKNNINMLEVVSQACNERFEETITEAFHASRLRPNLPKPIMKVRFPGGKELITQVGRKFLSQQNREFQWLPEYDKIAAWLTNNEGKGLLLSGAPGRGKTLITQCVIPFIIKSWAQYTNRPWGIISFHAGDFEQEDVYRLNNPKLLYGFDDLGVEQLVDNRNRPLRLFDQIVERAVEHGLLLVVTTNLSKSQLAERYSSATLDRLYSVTRLIACPGESLRPK